MPGRQSNTAIKRDPDRFLEIKLSATARRLSTDKTEYPAAVAELRTIANGRADLLAIAAAGILGGYLSTPKFCDPRDIRAAAMLVEAGAEASHIPSAVDEVRRGLDPHFR